MTKNKHIRPKLIFVYNADSGIINAVKDCLHKLISPKSYPCKLCDLTYGAFAEKNRWKAFRAAYPGELEFLHADEFITQYKLKTVPNYELPIVLIKHMADLGIFIDSKTMGECEGLTDFIKLIEVRLERLEVF